MTQLSLGKHQSHLNAKQLIINMKSLILLTLLIPLVLLTLPPTTSAKINIDNYIHEDESPDYLYVPQLLIMGWILILTLPMQAVVLVRTVLNLRIFWAIFAIVYMAMCYFNVNRRWFDPTWHLPPRHLFALYLPISLFRTGYMIDLHTLKRSVVQVLIVGVFSIIIKVSMLSFIMVYVLDSSSETWQMSEGFILGASLSPIEISKQLNTLNDYERYKHLVTILEGEELFATVTTILIFELALGIYEGYISKWYQVILIIIRLLGFGLLWGLFCGLVISWLIRIFNDGVNVVMLTLVGTYITYFVGEYLLGTSGPMVVAVAALLIAKEKSSMSIDVDTYVNVFWDILSDMNSAVFTVALLGMIFDRLAYTASFSMFPPVFCTYVVSGLTRLFSLLLMLPILTRTGYGMGFRNMLLLVWANTKGPAPLIMGLTFFHYKNSRKHGTQVLAHISGLYLLCLIINSSTLNVLLKIFGFMELSNVRKSNMNNCMKFLQEKRDGMISILKMNRFLSDANWPVVQDATMLQHPYRLKITHDDEDSFFWGTRESVCPTCKKNIYIAPTSKEIKDMTMEARMRVLKTQRISYIRQYESGMLSKVGIRSLLQAVEVAIDSTEPIIKLDDYFKMVKKKHSHEWLKIFIIKILRKGNSEKKVPLRRYPRFFYNIVNSKNYTVVLVLVIITNMAFITLAMLISATETTRKGQSRSSKYIPNVVIVIYSLDAVAKIISHIHINLLQAIKSYFRNLFNVIDVLVILLYIGLLICRFHNWFLVERIIMFALFIRVFRLFNIRSNLAPKIIRACEHSMDRRVMFAYDVGKALVTGYEESLDILTQMVENKTVRDSIKKQIEDDRLTITKELGLIQKDSPWIAISIKTKQATRATLNHMRSAVTDLKMSGFVDDFEYDKLKDSIEDSLRQERLLRVITMSSPKRLFKEVQWTGLHNDISDFLYENVAIQIWDTGDIIVKCGKSPESVFILVTGLFRISYTPDKVVLANVTQRGMLPIMDYIPSSKFEESMEEFIFSGNSMGELCLVTNRPYNSTVIAESPSQAFILSHAVMREAMEKDKNPVNGLEARIWKFVSVTLACEILQDMPAYQSMTQEEVRLTLVRAFIPNLSCYKIFVVNELIQDVVLIEGVIMDCNSRQYYTAPCYIPRTVHKITTSKSSFFTRRDLFDIKVKLLIIPGKDVEEMDIMDKAEELSDLVPNPSNSCLIPKTYGKKMQRKRRLSRKARDDERKRQQKVFSTPEAEEDWVTHSMGKIQVIDEDDPGKKASIFTNSSLTTVFSSEKSGSEASHAEKSEKELKPEKTEYSRR